MTETKSINFKVIYLLMVIKSSYNFRLLSRNILTRILHYIQPNQSNSHTERREQASKKPLCPKPNFQAQFAVPAKKIFHLWDFPLTSSQSIRYNVTFRDGWFGGFSNTHQASRYKRTVAKKTHGEGGASESSDVVCSRRKTSGNRKEVN